MNQPRSSYTRSLDLQEGRVELVHGSGGKASAQLIEELFARAFDNEYLRQGNDGALLPPLEMGQGRLVMATDAHVVSPLFFPGGDIGCLSIHGTVNDVAVMGAKPLWIAAAFILEEGFPLAELARIVDSMARAAREAGVTVVTGDTKVVEKGKGDGVFITTTGFGVTYPGVTVGGELARPGDVVLISGSIGDHGMAILSQRENLGFESPIHSDTAALNGLVAALVQAVPGVHVMRDPTRGGLATTLNEIARQSKVGVRLEEAAIPVRESVSAACEFLGLDPLYSPCEGRMVVICGADDAETALSALRSHVLGREAARIGQVVEDAHHFVSMRTRFGGQRIVDWLVGEQLPRIC